MKELTLGWNKKALDEVEQARVPRPQANMLNEIFTIIITIIIGVDASPCSFQKYATQFDPKHRNHVHVLCSGAWHKQT